MTLTATKIDSSHESGNNFIKWAWAVSTVIIYNNNPVLITMKKIIFNYTLEVQGKKRNVMSSFLKNPIFNLNNIKVMLLFILPMCLQKQHFYYGWSIK
jgi:hypothetical protein